jgi:hypothetical protein
MQKRTPDTGAREHSSCRKTLIGAAGVVKMGAF